jgi:hypothetical protein
LLDSSRSKHRPLSACPNPGTHHVSCFVRFPNEKLGAKYTTNYKTVR